MARVVISFDHDISPIAEVLSPAIPGYSFDPKSGLAMIRKGELIVTSSPFEILIYNTDQESEARDIMRWLQNILKSNCLTG